MEPLSADEPYRIIGRVHPLEGIDLRCVKVSAAEAHVESSLRDFCHHSGLMVHACIVRNPNRDQNFQTAARQPHQDLSKNPLAVIWASAHPTIFSPKDIARGILACYPKPFDVVFYDDRYTVHQKPHYIGGRWFARLEVSLL